tara:strand:- start:67 stop:351 length:285 start_codon:yes stop_codon:yes gene_type:complete
MRLITKESIQAFNQNRNFKKSNMQIIATKESTKLLYQGNTIAIKENNILKITNCGWFSNTTKERLNALNGVSLYQKDFIWYLNGKEWDGNFIEI